MAAPELIRVKLGDDVEEFLVAALSEAAREADLFDAAPCVYISSTERRARAVSRRVLESYPEGTPDRVARELLREFEPDLDFRGEVERDFDFFGALDEALNELGENRRPGRALVDELIASWKRVAQTIPPARRTPDRLDAWLRTLGGRGRLLGGVVQRYLARLAKDGRHDPEDALWLAAERMEAWSVHPALVVIDDLDRITPAREALLQSLCRVAGRAIVIARGIRGLEDELGFTADAHDVLQELTHSGGGVVADEREDWPQLKGAATVRSWLDGARDDGAGIEVLRPASRAAEVAEAARAIKRAAKVDTALSEICVAMPSTGAYRELIEEVFAGAGIPFDAPFEVALSATPIVSAVLDLVRAARGDLGRTEVLDALSSPYLPFAAKDDEARLRLLRDLEAATRDAWVVGGRDVDRDWIGKLDASSHGAWPQIREPVRAVLALLKPLTARAMRAGDFFDALETLVDRSGASAVATRDRRSGDPGAGAREGALHQFKRLLAEMSAEFRRGGNKATPVNELLRALTEQAETRTIRPPEPAADRVRVLGLRELRGVRFERLIVLGLTDQDLPLNEEDLMFLPTLREDALAAVLGKRVARELCAPVDVTSQADYLFAHMLLASRGPLTLMMPGSQGDTPFVAATPFARLLRCLGKDDIESLPEASDGTPPVSPGDLAARAGVSLARLERGERTAKASLNLAINGESPLAVGMHGRKLELARTDLASAPTRFEGFVGDFEELAARFAADGPGRHTFSPSQLDNYVECPMRFWARYVVRAKAPEDPTLDTRPHAVGTLVHDVLERWAHLLRREAGQDDVLPDPLTREPVSLLEIGGDADSARELGLRLMVEAFDKACEKNPTEGPFWEGVKKLVAAGLPGQAPGLGRGLLARFVDHEVERNEAGAGIKFCEFDFGKDNSPEPARPDAIPEPLEVEIPGGSLRLMGSVDRVDEGPDGLEIIDYKTGGAKSTREVRDGMSFQLPVYLAAISRLADRTPSGMVYLHVPTDGEIKPLDVTLFRNKPAYDVGELVFEKLPARLARILGALRHGVFTHLPFSDAKPCRYCEYATACARRLDVIEERQIRMTRAETPEVEHVYLPDGDQP